MAPRTSMPTKVAVSIARLLALLAIIAPVAWPIACWITRSGPVSSAILPVAVPSRRTVPKAVATPGPPTLTGSGAMVGTGALAPAPLPTLTALNVAADRHLKTVTLARASEFARYLDARLATVVVAEHRVALTSMLSDQENQIMLASSNSPYAADLVEAPTSSLAPTSPRAIIVLVASLLFNLILERLGQWW